MNTRTQFMILSVVAILFLLSCGDRVAQCPLCNREIHEHMGVKITHNSIPMKTCCMSCALTYAAQEKNVHIVSVTDFMTNASLAPENAFYIVASDISPCTQDAKVRKVIREQHATLFACYDRCEPSILAFSKKEDAVLFQRQNGGHLESFGGLIQWLPVAGAHHHDQ
ncbi:MAG: hypothetical protein C5B54_05825 [Acidobacteria bacterium]|nr:MAG: hypothetical protein C5B54_05825 [Acidobacteriota bacterium]